MEGILDRMVANPQSLGVLNPTGTTAMDLAAAIRASLPKASGLAVSVEPPGGSPACRFARSAARSNISPIEAWFGSDTATPFCNSKRRA